MMIQKQIICGIPVLAGFQEDADASPLIMLAHGFRGSKDDWREKLPQLMAEGFSAVALDNRGLASGLSRIFSRKCFQKAD